MHMNSDFERIGDIAVNIAERVDALEDYPDLLDRAAAGEEIVISKNGIPYARLVPIVSRGMKRIPANAMRIDHIADDFDAPVPEMERLFAGDPE